MKKKEREKIKVIVCAIVSPMILQSYVFLFLKLQEEGKQKTMNAKVYTQTFWYLNNLTLNNDHTLNSRF